jgi:uncharacterized membrane protein
MNKNFKIFMEQLLKYFLQGLLYAAPISITIYALIKVLGMIDGILPFRFPGIGILCILVSLTVLGFLANTIVARPIMYYVGKLIERTPIIKILYTSVKDLMKAFMGDKKKFNEPVLVTMDKNSGIEKLGFVTRTDLTKLGIAKGKVAVYFPIAYNMSGDLFIVPAENVVRLSGSSSEIMKFIISGGVTGV